MRFISMRVFNGTTFFGYVFDDSNTPYWSMRFYPETWHVPMTIREEY